MAVRATNGTDRRALRREEAQAATDAMLAQGKRVSNAQLALERAEDARRPGGQKVANSLYTYPKGRPGGLRGRPLEVVTLRLRARDGLNIAVVQIAGLVARRIVSFVREGDAVGAG